MKKRKEHEISPPLFSHTAQFLMVSRICHSKEQERYISIWMPPETVACLFYTSAQKWSKAIMNNFTTTQLFNTIYTAQTKNWQRSKNPKQNKEILQGRERERPIPLERTPIVRTFFGSLIVWWNLKGATEAKWIWVIEWRECTTMAKIFRAVYGVEPCKLFLWWKSTFSHAEGKESNLK